MEYLEQGLSASISVSKGFKWTEQMTSKTKNMPFVEVLWLNFMAAHHTSC